MDATIVDAGILDYIPTETEKKEDSEEPGIELQGFSLGFFKVAEAVLDARKRKFLEKLLPNFLNACQRILEYCPEMSAFKGTWQSESITVISIEKAVQFVGEDFFTDMTTCLFDEPPEDPLTKLQTAQVLGTFFISSLIKLYEAVMLQSLFQVNLRALAENLRENPVTKNSAKKQGLSAVSEIFQSKVATAKLLENVRQEFENIFKNLVFRNETVFVKLITLFFYKPFPCEMRKHADFILQDPASMERTITDKFISLRPTKMRSASTVDSTSSSEREENAPDSEQDSEEEPEVQDEKQALIIKHALHIRTAFEVMEVALKTISDATEFEILGRVQKLDEFTKAIQIKVQSNLIFSQYFVAAHTGIFRENDFYEVCETASVLAKTQEIIQEITQILDSPDKMTPFAHFFLPAHASDTIVLGYSNPPLSTVDVSDPRDAKFKLHYLKLPKGKRRLICCYPRDRETFSALLNANPLVKALLLSQVLLAVVLQISRVDKDFKDVSTIMWLEPFLALIGFACGVYALTNPKEIANPPIRIGEALAASSVVLTKSLGIAILAHTTLFPEESGPGGIDIERFLKVVASAPITVALLFWVYNSIPPNFKERHLPKRVRFISELINHFAIYCGLIQIISIAIVKVMNRTEKVDFSTQSSRISFELLPMIPAPFFAYARVAPIRFCCGRSGVHVNISETVNTAVLNLFTALLLANLGIDLSQADNLSEAQTNFRRVFFPVLGLASTIVMAHYARNFSVKYDGNPEVIIQKVISERGLQPLGDGTFSLGGKSQPLLDGGDDETYINYEAAEALRKGFESSETSSREEKGKSILLMHALDKEKRKRKQDDQYEDVRPRTSNNEGKRARFGSCAML